MKRFCWFARLFVAGLSAAWLLGGCGGVSEPPHQLEQVTVCSATSQTLEPLPVAESDLRWRDIADELYADEFQAGFSYLGTETSYVTVSYEASAPTLSGTVNAYSLKPWFAYQMKLEGKAGILGADEASNQGDPLAWSSYQLGRAGRWWCEDCNWNVSDGELQSHLDQGHTVIGYLLFDWFVTNGSGDAVHGFGLDSSFHVLWKSTQRRPRGQDSALRTYELLGRGPDAYPTQIADTSVTVYAEWERTRPKPGQVQLAAGEYDVKLNLTEESFHANLTYPLEEGGFWAQVLAGDLQFEVTGGEPPAETGSIAGKVAAGGGRGIAGAKVTVVETEQSAVTNRAGRYSIGEVPAGTYSMTAYHEQSGSDGASGVVVEAGSTTKQDFDLN